MKILSLFFFVAGFAFADAKEDTTWKYVNKNLADEVAAQVKKYPNIVGVPTLVFNRQVDKDTGLVKSDLSDPKKYTLALDANFTAKEVAWDEESKTPSKFSLNSFGAVDANKPVIRLQLGATAETNVLRLLNYTSQWAILISSDDDSILATQALAKAKDMKDAKKAWIDLMKSYEKEAAIRKWPLMKSVYADIISQVEKNPAEDVIEFKLTLDLKSALKDLGADGIKIERLHVKLDKSQAKIDLVISTEDKDTNEQWRPTFALVKGKVEQLTADPLDAKGKELQTYLVDSLFKATAEMSAKRNPKEKQENPFKKIPLAHLIPMSLPVLGR